MSTYFGKKELIGLGVAVVIAIGAGRAVLNEFNESATGGSCHKMDIKLADDYQKYRMHEGEALKQIEKYPECEFGILNMFIKARHSI